MAHKRAIAEKVQDLSDLELATLLCLVAHQHCIIETVPELVDAVTEELQLISANVFGLRCAILQCSGSTNLDEFGDGLLVPRDGEDDDYGTRSLSRTAEHNALSLPAASFQSARGRSPSPGPLGRLDDYRIADVVIAKHLNTASDQVQLQSLELARSKRIFTRTAVRTAPKRFLFIAVVAVSSRKLTPHLNDYFFISHRHYSEDGLPNLEERGAEAQLTSDTASESSVIRKPQLDVSSSHQLQGLRAPVFDSADLDAVTGQTADVQISSEVRAYLHNIVVFLRLHRAIKGGVSPLATRHFEELSRALAPLHGLDYVPPSLVALAARKVYMHRIVLTEPENERSTQWGSSIEAVRVILEGVTVGDVIDEVIEAVEVPL